MRRTVTLLGTSGWSFPNRTARRLTNGGHLPRGVRSVPRQQPSPTMTCRDRPSFRCPVRVISAGRRAALGVRPGFRVGGLRRLEPRRVGPLVVGADPAGIPNVRILDGGLDCVEGQTAHGHLHLPEPGDSHGHHDDLYAARAGRSLPMGRSTSGCAARCASAGALPRMSRARGNPGGRPHSRRAERPSTA